MQSKTFVRDATGLVREYGGLDVLLFASALVFALVFSTTQFAWFYGNTGGANLTISLLVAAVPFIFLMVTYWVIGIVMPRTGNDYIWTGRVFHPSIGFVWSLVYVFGGVFFAGYVGACLNEFSFAFSIALTTVGLTSNSPGLANLGTFLGGPIGTFELGIVLVLVTGAFAVFGSRFVKGLMYSSWVAAIIGTLLMWYIMGSVSNATFASNWNTLLVPSFGNNATYQALQSGGMAGGYTPTTGFGSIIAALPLASLFLFGGNYANAFAGEIKNVRKSIPIALFLSLFFGIIWWSITSTLTLNAVGTDWMSSVGYAWVNGLHSYTLPFPPSQPLMLAVAAYPNNTLIDLMMAFYLVGSLAPLFAYLWIPSKYIFAWAFDRVIPSKFADVNERFHTPTLAILGIMGISIIGLGAFLFLGWGSAFTLGTVIWGVSFVIPALALVVFPYVKKDLFEQSPGFVKTKIASIPVMSIIGLITAILFAAIAYIAYITPADVVPTTFGFEVVAAIIVVGFAIYFASWGYHKSRGLDISMALKAIPPE
ncbi:MAG TPA: amino acid permease [Candidatus Saccharimonadales bacterium]|nr:amino acid permease [Candidatus Saccharimonadales bacterium]